MQLSVEKKSSKAKLYSPTQRGRVVAVKAVTRRQKGGGSRDDCDRRRCRRRSRDDKGDGGTAAAEAVAAGVIQARAQCEQSSSSRLE